MNARGRASRIALYGGTFDPVHDGHLAVARELLKLFALDEMRFIPAHVAPHKRGLTSAAPLHRYAMLALATQGDEKFRLSTVELDEPERPYTVETITRLQQTDAQLFFVMGADSWEEITTWREWERLLALVSHIVVTRPGHELSTQHVPATVRERIVDLRASSGASNIGGGGAAEVTNEPRVYFTDVVKLDISSTAIRRRVACEANGESLESSIRVPQPVAEYIKKYRLYREAHETEATEGGRTHAHDQGGRIGSSTAGCDA